MILVDFSALVFQMMYSSITAVKPSEKEGKLCTAEFAPFMLYKTFETLFGIQSKFSEYGEVVLCLDGESKANWRKKLYPMYKSSRSVNREASNINFAEVFDLLGKLIGVIENATPWRVIKVNEAEGDDVVMVLAKHFNSSPVMIISSDKDMIQMQCFGNIQQFSFLTQKFITPETKHDDTMDEWLLEHVILGDPTDDVPRVVDGLEFTDSFKTFLKNNNLNMDELTVRNSDWNSIGFTEYRMDKNGKPKELDIFKKERFGISTCKKLIAKHGSLDSWLNTDPRLRSNYELNRKLVLEEGIPENVRNKILSSFATAKNEAKIKELRAFFNENQINHLELILPPNFTKNAQLSDFF